MSIDSELTCEFDSGARRAVRRSGQAEDRDRDSHGVFTLLGEE